LKNESEDEKTSDSALREHAVGNKVWHGRGMDCTACCCTSWLFVEFFALKWWRQPQVRVLWWEWDLGQPGLHYI